MINVAKEVSYLRLVECLEKQVRIYRHLLDIVRNEKDDIVSANMNELEESNKAKEAMLPKLRNLERTRMKLAQDLSRLLGDDIEAPSLLGLAAKVDSQSADRLRSIHTTLNLLIRRVKKHNEENERIVNASLEVVQGSIESMKKAMGGNPTYKKKGNVEDSASAGRFVSRQV